MRVINEPVRCDHAEVALRRQRADQLSSCQLLDKVFRAVSRSLCDLLERGFIDPSKNSINPGRVSDQYDSASRSGALLSVDRDRLRMILGQIYRRETKVEVFTQTFYMYGQRRTAAREVRAKGQYRRFKSITRNGHRVSIVPPRLKDMMVCENVSSGID